jgi:hypothetical protein
MHTHMPQCLYTSLLAYRQLLVAVKLSCYQQVYELYCACEIDLVICVIWLDKMASCTNHAGS